MTVPGNIMGMQYLETSTDMNDDHDFGDTDNPDGVA